jgi:transposase
VVNEINEDSKVKKLKEKGGLNPKPQNVKDELFQDYDFFDPRDLFQVKYEMVRRVQKDRWNVAKASKTFGFSRKSFYEIQNVIQRKGLAGLIPRKRGPISAHKLTGDVMKFIEQAVREDDTLRAPQMVSLIEEHFGFKVHPRSIERALERRKKNERKSIRKRDNTKSK